MQIDKICFQETSCPHVGYSPEFHELQVLGDSDGTTLAVKFQLCLQQDKLKYFFLFPDFCSACAVMDTRYRTADFWLFI